tara:strand:+ start:278 stop:1006 length:729 start_codon:yes stop_codon:yes gene_type:complete
MSEQNEEQTWKLVESEPLKKSTPKLAKALAEFQAVFSNAVRDAGGNFGSYVSLSEAEFAVSPATKFGISHTFITECSSDSKDQPMMWMVCRLMHESGEFIDSRLPINIDWCQNSNKNKYFSIGSAITYTRRYMLLGAYGLGQADDEADAWSQKAADSDNTGKASKGRSKVVEQKVTTTLAPQGKTKLSQDEFNQLRAELNSRPDKSEIMKNFKKTYFPSKDKVLATDIEFKEHESYIRKFMV